MLRHCCRHRPLSSSAKLTPRQKVGGDSCSRWRGAVTDAMAAAIKTCGALLVGCKQSVTLFQWSSLRESQHIRLWCVAFVSGNLLIDVTADVGKAGKIWIFLAFNYPEQDNDGQLSVRMYTLVAFIVHGELMVTIRTGPLFMQIQPESGSWKKIPGKLKIFKILEKNKM